ncbi:MAG TPA: protein kinase [Thermoanaerobaculia bacterium]|nr:protein kinase [Thermoanaerobaculia bacterium]
MQSSWEPDFFIADWRVCPALGKLERGEDSIPIEPRTMQFLSCLARHAPDLVSKQRLMREVWRDAYVTDEVMTHAVWELRKAFGDDAKNPRYIQTLSKKGYRLVAEVSHAAPEPLAAGSRIGQYEILEPLAGGARGEVYKAKDTRLGRTVALKFLPADLCRDLSARKRFLREAQAVAQIDHPYVATIYDAGETEGGRAYLALAFYEGETLQQKLERGPLPIAEAVDLVRQIAKGLAAAHRQQIVHRDIKPANLVILPDGMVRILDFGLAKLTGATTLTRLGASPGTPAYKSPEQTRGEKVDPRSDLWALGVVLYEMVTGWVPFGGDYEQAVIYSILNQPLPSLEGLPANLAAVIHRALEKDAGSRYQTAEEMEVDLAAVSEGRKVVQSKPGIGRSWVPRKVLNLGIGRKRLLAVLLAVVIPGLAVGIWYWREHRWDFSPEVRQYIERGEQLEWHSDTERILGDAEKAYRMALAFDPENPVVMAYLAAFLTRITPRFPPQERLVEIRQLTNLAVALAPDHPMPWIARAKLLLLEGKPAEAELAARNAIDRKPDFDRGYTILGEALIDQREVKDGLEELKRGTEVGEGYLRARLVYGTWLKRLGRYKEAAIELRKVLDLNPNQSTALHNLGEVYIKTGREDDALPLLRKAVELKEWRSAHALGNLYLKMGRDREADKYFIDAYRGSRDPILASNLAKTYEKLGQADRARNWYSIAIEGVDRQLAQGESRGDSGVDLRPYLLYSRSIYAAKLGRFDEAFVNVEEARALEPTEVLFAFRAAQVYLLAGRRDEAFSYLRRAIREGLSRDKIRNDFVFEDYLDDPKFREILEGN